MDEGKTFENLIQGTHSYALLYFIQRYTTVLFLIANKYIKHFIPLSDRTDQNIKYKRTITLSNGGMSVT
jgi:hypothetical protein